MIHPLNLSGGWIEIRTTDGPRRVSTRRYRISTSSPFPQHVGKVVRLIGVGRNEHPGELLATMVRCALETQIFDGTPFPLDKVILSALTEIDPIADGD